MSHDHTWEEAQAEEELFWGDCSNTFGEELKQMVYARYMGLVFQHNGESSHHLVLPERLSILDVGGGPVSLLLKAPALERKEVIDPCNYPLWVTERYDQCGISFVPAAGEKINTFYTENSFDEVWMYNVLQHVSKPEKILENIYRVLKPGGVFRFFDWVDTPTNTAHPIALSSLELAAAMSEVGFTGVNGHTGEVNVKEFGCVGKAFAGWVLKES